MAANQLSLSSPTQIDFSFSPYMEKPAQYDTFFNDSCIAQHNNNRTSLLQNFLSPTSPNTRSTSFANSDIDQVFAELIANTQLSSVVSLGGAQEEQQRSVSAGLVHHHQQPISEVVPMMPTEKAASKLAPLAIPEVAQHLPAAVALPAMQECMEENGRQWQTVFVNPAFANLVEVSVTSKTRCEEPSSEVPDKLYSSLKYEIRQQAVGAACAMVPFLLGRITVVDAADFSEILKDKKSVLKGTVEGSLVRPPVCQSDNKLEGSLKVQFTDVSYHHKKKGFCFQISYFVPSDLEHPILIKRSSSFMVFARKPNQNKKRRKNEPSENFEQFCARLEDLVSCSKKLKPMEKQNALSLVSNKLLQLDPTFFIAQLQQQVQQPANEQQ